MQVVQIDRDYLETLTRRASALEHRVKALETANTPTVPIYDSANMPSLAVEGQIAIATGSSGGGGGGSALSPVYTSYNGLSPVQGTVSVQTNQSGNCPLPSAPYSGTEVFDRSTPSSPKILVAGVYQFSFRCRFVIPLSYGAFSAGWSFVASIGGVPGQPMETYVWPSAGTFTPEVEVTSMPVSLAANAVVNFTVSNQGNFGLGPTYACAWGAWNVSVAKLA